MKLKRPWAHRKQRGASLMEYALLVSLVAVVAITSVTYAGTSVYCQYNDTALMVQDGLRPDEITPEMCEMRNGGLPPALEDPGNGGKAPGESGPPGDPGPGQPFGMG